MKDHRMDVVEGAFICLNHLSNTVIDDLRNIIVGGLSEVATKTKCSMAQIERLCSAWHQDCSFVQRCVERLEPSLSELLDTHYLLDSHTLSGATLFVNSLHHKMGTHAHQDLSYRWRQSDCRYALSTWVPLSNVGPDSGALTFGAMPHQPLTVRQDFLHSDFNNFIHKTSDVEWHTVSANQGDVLIFDSTVWHASKPCRTVSARYALALRWRSKSRWENQLSVPMPKSMPNQFGMETSGKLLISVITEYMRINDVERQFENLVEYVDWMLEHSFSLRESEKECLSDLHQALVLEKFKGRTAADVWIRVRDEFVLPRLSSRY